MLFAKYYYTESNHPTPREVLGTLDSNCVIDGRLCIANAIYAARCRAMSINHNFNKGIKSFVIFRGERLTDERKPLTKHIDV